MFFKPNEQRLSCLLPPSGEKSIHHDENILNRNVQIVVKLTLSKMISSYLYIPSLPFTCQDKKNHDI